MTEKVARERFQHHAALIPPEVGLRLYCTGAGEARQLLAEKAPMRTPAAPVHQAM